MPRRWASGASTSSVCRAIRSCLLRRQEAQRAHVVQPVGQLDDQHPGVAGHRHDHLADGLGLGRVAVLDLVQLGHAVDEMGHLGVEVVLDVVQRVAGVLDGVVQQRGHQRGGVHAQLGQDGRHRERVGDVRVAGLAQLAAVLLLGDVVRPLQDAQVGLGVGGPVGGDQRLQHRLDAGRALPAGGEPAGQPGPDPAPVGRRVRLAAGRQRLGFGVRRVVVEQQREAGQGLRRVRVVGGRGGRRRGHRAGRATVGRDRPVHRPVGRPARRAAGSRAAGSRAAGSRAARRAVGSRAVARRRSAGRRAGAVAGRPGAGRHARGRRAGAGRSGAGRAVAGRRAGGRGAVGGGRSAAVGVRARRSAGRAGGRIGRLLAEGRRGDIRTQGDPLPSDWSRPVYGRSLPGGLHGPGVARMEQRLLPESATA